MLTACKIVAMPAQSAGPAPHNITADMQRMVDKLTHSSNAKDASPPQTLSQRRDSNKTKTQNNPGGIEEIAGAIEGYSFVGEASVVDQASAVNRGPDSTEDDQSHLSNSSSKPQSFDTKSMASMTTFAMDEKESIQPDDSASVRAADEDESMSGPPFNSAANHANEQSVNPPRVFPRFTVNSKTLAGRRYPTITMANPPRFGSLPLSPNLESDPANIDRQPSPITTDRGPVESQFATLIISPDEKLLEALATLKDRLPLLQMEETILAFLAQNV